MPTIWATEKKMGKFLETYNLPRLNKEKKKKGKKKERTNDMKDRSYMTC